MIDTSRSSFIHPAINRLARDKAIDIRQPDLSEIETIERIETEAFSTDRLSRRSIKHLLTRANAEVLVATLGNEIIGYATLLFRRGSRVCRLYSLAVARAHLRKGAARRLLSSLEQAALGRNCDSMRLEVRADNVGAADLYRKAGFRGIGHRRAYYADGADALILEKKIHCHNLTIDAGATWPAGR